MGATSVQQKIEPVLVVGGGPVGLALAGDLGWRGIGCALIEQSDGSIYQPRMDLVGIRTMEFCRRWGLVPAVEGSPYPRDYAQDNIYLTSLTGHELGRERFPGIGQAPPPKESPQRRERCPQNMFDPILREFAASQNSRALRYRTRLVSFAQDSDVVTATVENAETGACETIKAQYIVGCDGARSLVRETLGIRMLGNPVLTYTTNVIFRCPHLLSLHDKGKAYRHIFIGPEGTWSTIVAINGRDEWRFSIIGGIGAARVHDRGHQSGDPPRCRPRFRFRDFERAAVGAARTGGRALPQRPRLHRRRCRARHVADRRLRHEYRHRRCGRSVMEARRHDRGLGRRRTCSIPMARERHPSAPAMSPKRAATCAGCSRLRRTPDLLDDTPQGAATRAKVGREFAETMSREWHTLGVHLGYRYEGVADLLARRLRSACRTIRESMCRPRGPDTAPRMPGSPMGARRSTCSAAASPFSASAHVRRGGAASAAAQRRKVPMTFAAIAEPHVAALYAAQVRAGAAGRPCGLA